ncbi:TIGR03086 family metal-binding protein [Streptomyces sp. NBC_01356]|uniref:TIGR03086 family metal-binding protein n=1 Tax=Streptomyces sp. NBC_01356 TaxID=2903836 RepID=UPI002E3395B4|nr:TIGR03086 family metal-binding protein [Streptomyces sp. NBC_01356]
MNPGELLERSLAYALGSVAVVVPGSLGRATPCSGWDLGELLRHLDDSVEALYEGVAAGRVGLCSSPATADPVCAFRERACALLGAWAVVSGEVPSAEPSVGVGDGSLDLGLLAAVGAVEIAVHGWDVAQACGRSRPIPPALAAELLPVARWSVADVDRGVRFAEPVGAPSSWSRPGDRLLAFLGRRPSPPRFLSGPGPVCLP